MPENSYAFRLTEAYLLEAEAIASSNGDLNQAKTLLKTVQAHAGITNFGTVDAAASASDLQVLIVKEEIKSFVDENGADWFALRRLPLEVAKTLQPSLTSNRQYVMPAPQAEINANNQLTQIPGY